MARKNRSKVKLFGIDVKSAVSKIKQKFLGSALQVQINLAEDFRDAVVDYIYNQEGANDYLPLSEKWQEYKAEHGLDPRFHIATSEYMGSIDVFKVKSRGYKEGYSIRVGLPDREHSEWGINLIDLGLYLEYNIVDPPRSHWRPVYRRFGNLRRRLLTDAMRRIEKDVKAEIRRIKANPTSKSGLKRKLSKLKEGPKGSVRATKRERFFK